LDKRIFGLEDDLADRVASERSLTVMNRRALLALAVAGLAWGLTVPLTKVVLEWIDPAWATVARFGLAAPVLAVVARRTLRDAATPLIAAWGAAGFGAVIVLQNVGIARTSVTHAAVILGAVPVLVALAAAALGRSAAGQRQWAGFVAALAGIGLVAGTGGDASAAGDGLMLASAVLSAALIVAQARLLPGRDPVAVTAVQMGAAAVAVLPVALLAGEPPVAPPTGGQVLAGLGLVTVGSLVPFTLYAYGQARTSAEVAGAFVNLEPLVGVALGGVWFGDPLGAPTLAGGLAILAGIGLSALPNNCLGWRPGNRWLQMLTSGTLKGRIPRL
jgi:drug/metabolite transporter (DMT)-like permease